MPIEYFSHSLVQQGKSEGKPVHPSPGFMYLTVSRHVLFVYLHQGSGRWFVLGLMETQLFISFNADIHKPFEICESICSYTLSNTEVCKIHDLL